MNKSVIIVAGGAGKRMESTIPKQFMLFNDKPVLMHTIVRFYTYDPTLNIIVVLPNNEIETWRMLINKFSFSIPHSMVEGGATRFHSVKNGLAALKQHCIVAVHDGVRPFCSKDLIKRCFEEAAKKSNAVPAIKISETIREVEGEKNYYADRDKYRIIQTPQCFDSELLKKAYTKLNSENFTDDAGVFENDGNKIHLVEGEKFNIKITVKDDLQIAELIDKIFFNEKVY